MKCTRAYMVLAARDRRFTQENLQMNDSDRDYILTGAEVLVVRMHGLVVRLGLVCSGSGPAGRAEEARLLARLRGAFEDYLRERGVTLTDEANGDGRYPKCYECFLFDDLCPVRGALEAAGTEFGAGRPMEDCADDCGACVKGIADGGTGCVNPCRRQRAIYQHNMRALNRLPSLEEIVDRLAQESNADCESEPPSQGEAVQDWWSRQNRLLQKDGGARGEPPSCPNDCERCGLGEKTCPFAPDRVVLRSGHLREVAEWSRGAITVSPVLEPSRDNPSGEYVQIPGDRSADGNLTAGPGDAIDRRSDGRFLVRKWPQVIHGVHANRDPKVAK
jgi:hypothetical protein